MFKNARIRIKFLIGFGIILIMMFLSNLFAFYNFNGIQSAQDKIINEAVPLDKIVRDTNIQILNESKNVRSYVTNNGDEKFLNSYNESRQIVEKNISDVKKYYKSDKELSSLMENQELPAVKDISSYFESQIQLVKDGKSSDAVTKLEGEKEYLDQYQKVHDKLTSEINNFNRDTINNAKGKFSQAKLIIGIIFVVSIFITIFIAMFFSGKIVGQIEESISFLKKLSDGNLAVKPLLVDSKDELGELASALNFLQESTKGIISAIVEETRNVHDALVKSNEDIANLTSQLEDVSATVEELSAGTEETASSTEEISASSSEFEAAVESVADRAQKGAQSADEISAKAVSLKESSIALELDAKDKISQIKKIIDEALEKSKEVEKIKTLSDAILEISAETNLLALNASIESARAGEAGRGFAVVADSIRKLAESSEDTVNEMQETISVVFEAVGKLSKAASYTLEYIQTKVIKSYEDSVEVGENYDKDAAFISELVTDLSATSEELLAAIRTMSESIYEISKANTESATGTTDIAEKISGIRDSAADMKLEVDTVKQSSKHLRDIVSKFRVADTN